MPLIYCVYDQFVLKHSIYSLDPNTNMCELLYNTNSIDKVCECIAQYYNTGEYSKILLAGSGAEGLKEQILQTYTLNYNKKDIEIEVIKG